MPLKALPIFLFLLQTSAPVPVGKPVAKSPEPPASQPSPKIEKLDFAAEFAGFEGCFLAREVEVARLHAYNEPRTQFRFPPCSTFKIPHALIALDCGALDGPDHLLKWDGEKRWNENWNKDHTLRSAMRDSVLWYFQETARRIGENRLRAAFQRLDFGNGDCSGELTTFWLNGPLLISASEQMQWLDRLRRGDLPFDKAAQQSVRDLILIDTQDAYALRGKTGTRGENGKITLGWFVGWVERNGKTLVFATNITAADNAWGPTARDITRSILKKIGWGPPVSEK